MNSIFRWLKLALPFLELGYEAALLTSPEIAAEIKLAIDALERAANTPIPVDPNAPARGSAQIDAFGKQVMDALKALKTSTVSAAEKTSQANTLVASLSDPTKVYQAKHGEDAAILLKYKTDARAAADAINL